MLNDDVERTPKKVPQTRSSRGSTQSALQYVLASNATSQFVSVPTPAPRVNVQTERVSAHSARVSSQIVKLEKRELHERILYGPNVSVIGAVKQAMELKLKKQPKSRFALPLGIKHDLQEAFKIIDNKGTGLLTQDNLRIALRCLGFEPKHEDLSMLCDLVSYKDRLGLTYSDFEYIMTRTMTVKDTEDELRNAFKLFSKTAKGEVNFEKLKEVNNMLGETLNDEELKEMIDYIDKNKNGKVSEEEFLEFCSDTVLWDCKHFK